MAYSFHRSKTDWSFTLINFLNRCTFPCQNALHLVVGRPILVRSYLTECIYKSDICLYPEDDPVLFLEASRHQTTFINDGMPSALTIYGEVLHPQNIERLFIWLIWRFMNVCFFLGWSLDHSGTQWAIASPLFSPLQFKWKRKLTRVGHATRTLCADQPQIYIHACVKMCLTRAADGGVASEKMEFWVCCLSSGPHAWLS